MSALKLVHSNPRPQARPRVTAGRFLVFVLDQPPRNFVGSVILRDDMPVADLAGVLESVGVYAPRGLDTVETMRQADDSGETWSVVHVVDGQGQVIVQCIEAP